MQKAYLHNGATTAAAGTSRRPALSGRGRPTVNQSRATAPRSTTSSSSSPTSTAPARRRRTAVRAAILRMGVPVAARNIFPRTSRACPPGTRCGSSGRLARPPRRRRPHGRDEPADLGQGRRRDRPGGYLFYDSTKPLPPSRFRDDVTVIGMPLTAICNAGVHGRAAAAAVQEHHLPRRCPRCSTSIPGRREADRRAVRGQEKLLPSNREAFHHGPRLRAANFAPAADPRSAAATRSATASSSTATARRRWLRVRRRDGVRLVPDHAVVVARRGVRQILPQAAATTRHEEERYAILQAEDELASIGMVIGAAWNGRARSPPRPAPASALMQEFLGLAYFAEIPVVLFDVQRGSPRPACRRARSRRPACVRLRVARRHQARDDARRTRPSRSRWARRRSTSPTGCRRRCS